MTKQPAIICDIDGTLALKGNRGIYDWDKVIDDLPNFPIVEILTMYMQRNREHVKWEQTKIILITGRPEICESDTMAWLEHVGVEYDDLFMRKLGDRRTDIVVKSEIYETIKEKYKIQFVLDDRDRCVRMWRSYGITCLQVAEGNY